MIDLPVPEAGRVEREPYVLIARGDLSPQEREALTLRLARFNLETSFIPADEYDASQEPIYTTRDPRYDIRSITDLDHYLVREHIEDFVASYDGDLDLGKRAVGRLFHTLVDGSAYINDHLRIDRKGQLTRDPKPLPGVHLVRRGEAGFEPYRGVLDGKWTKSGACARFALKASSVLAADEAIHDPNIALPNAPISYGLVALLAAQLRSQIEPSQA